MTHRTMSEHPYHGATSRSLSLTGVTKAVVCAVLSVGRCI